MLLTKALCFAWTFSLSSDAFDLSNLSHLRDTLLDRDADAEAFLNDTITFGDARAAYDARVMIVDLGRCANRLSDTNFYKGFVVSTYGYLFRVCSDYTSYRAGKDGQTTSSTWGPAFSKTSQAYHTWEWLQFPNRYDIRDYSIQDMEFRAWNAMPQMYFPLMSPTDAPLGGNLAYMLWVKPSKKLVGNNDEYHDMGGCGFIRPAASTKCNYFPVPQKRMLWNIDLGSLISGIGSDLSVDPSKGYTYKGVEYETTADKQSLSNSYNDVNQFSLQPTATGIASEPLCGYAVAPFESQTQIMTRLKRLFTWL